MMGEIKQIYLGAESYKAQSTLSSSGRLYNCYAENTLTTNPIKTPAIFGIPGSDEWINLGSYNSIYGFTQMNGNLYVVCGLYVYKINANKVSTLIGTLGTAPNLVQMTTNGQQVTFITASGTGYYYTESTNTFAQITDPNYMLSSSVCTIDGYTILAVQGSNQFFLSNENDTSTYDALNYAYATAINNNIIRVIAFNRNLYIFGSNAIEIWQSTGVGTPPFQRIDGVFTQEGSIAPGSIVADINGVFFLGNDNMVYVMNGYQAQRVSTYGIEYIISQIPYTSDAIAFIYIQAGHRFYSITFPSANKTIVYDVTADLWHERGSFNSDGSMQIAWAATYGINYNNQILVNGSSPGIIYNLDLNTYSENGNPILMEIITPLVLLNYNNFTLNNLILIMDTGVGTTAPNNGSDPMIVLEFSIDGGKTWMNRAPALIGEKGNYRTRVNWTNLGKAREFILKFKITDAVKRAILGCYVQIVEGDF
jgi:Phage stabilisation protein